MTFSMYRDHVLCEDIFDSLLVFSEYSWVGNKIDNPGEKILPLPKELEKEVSATCYFKR